MVSRCLPYLTLVLLGILGWGIGLVSTFRGDVSRKARFAWLGFTVISAAMALTGGLMMVEEALPQRPAWVTLPDTAAEGP